MNFIYKGVEYADGTKVKMKTHYNGEQIMTYHSPPNVYESGFYGNDPTVGHIKIFTQEVNNLPIVEIVEPVYPIRQPINESGRQRPPIGSIDTGWAWYIVLMFGATFCHGNWALWILISIAFFTWKNGLWNGGKK